MLESRALSIRQPWAWLIVHGYKDIENRSRPTQYRGRLWIHAGLKFEAGGYAWVRSRFPDIALPEPDQFEHGGLVGSVELVDCVTEHASPWFSGTYGFVLRDARVEPFRPFPGRLGLFRIEG